METNPYKKLLEETQAQVRDLEKEKVGFISEIAGLKEQVTNLQIVIEKHKASQEEQKPNPGDV